jgi:seryl-tRNA synthetase
MTKDDVAGLVEGMRVYAKHAMPCFPNDLCSKAADLLESQANALREMDADRDNSNRLLDECRHERNVLQKICAERADALSAAESERDTLRARLKEAEKVIEPFINIRDQYPQSARLIAKKLDGFAPITVTVTKDQFLAARAFSKAQGG